MTASTPEREDPEREDPEREDPEREDPEREDPEREDPEREDPEREDPEREDPEREDPEREDQAADAKPRRSRLRRLLRLQARLFVGLLILLVVLRVLHPLYLPAVLSKVANALDLELVYEDLSLGVLDGTFTARGVVITPLEGGEPIVTVERVSAKVNVDALREDRLVYEYVDIQGLHGVLVIEPDNMPAIVRRIERALYGPGPYESKPGNDDFLWYDVMRVKDSTIRLVDHSVSPTVTADLAIEFVAKDWNSIRWPYWPNDVELWIGTRARPKAARLTSSSKGEDSALSFSVTDLDASAIEPYLARSGYRTDASTLDVDVTWRTKAPTEEAPRQLRIDKGSLVLDDSEALSFEQVALEPVYEPGVVLDLGRIQLSGLVVKTVRDEGGWHMEHFGLLPEKRDPRPPGSETRIGAIDFEASQLAYKDLTRDPPVNLALGVREWRVSAKADDRGRRGYRAKLFVPHLAREIAAVGSWTWPEGEGDPFSVTSRIDARGVTGGALAPYLAPWGASSALTDGALSFDLTTTTASVTSSAYRSRTTLRGLEVADGGRSLLRCDLVDVPALRIDADAEDYLYGDVVLRGVEADIVRRPNGLVEAFGFRAQPVRDAGPSTLRRFACGSVSAQLRRVRWENLQFHGRAPITLRAAQLEVKPFAVEGRRPGSSPPVELSLRGELAPIASECVIRAQVKPLIREPKTSLDLELRGLRGEGVLALAPELRGRYAADPLLGDGVFRTSMELTRLRPLRRAGPEGVRVDVYETELLGTAWNGKRPVLGTFASLKLEIDRYEHESGSVDASLLELIHPRLLVTRRESGVRVLGFRRLTAGERRGHPEEVSGPVGPERRIDRIHVAGAEVDYRDERADPPALLPLRDVDLEVHGFSMRAFDEPRPIRFRATAHADEIALPWGKTPKGYKRSVVLRVLTAGVIERPVEERDRFRMHGAFDSAVLEGQLILHPQVTGTVVLGVTELELANFRGLASKKNIEIRYGELDIQSKTTFHGADPVQLDAEFTFRDLKVTEPLGGSVGKALSLPAPLDVLIPVIRDADEEIRVPVHVTLGEDGVVSEETWRIVVPAMGKVIGRAFRDAPLKIAGLAKRVSKNAAQILPEAARDTLFKDQGPKLREATLRFDPGATHLAADQIARLEPILHHLREGQSVQITLQHQLGGGDVARVETRATPNPSELNALLRGLELRQRELLQKRRRARDAAALALREGDDAAVRRASRALHDVDATLGALAASQERTHQLLLDRSKWDVARRTREACVELGKRRLDRVYQTLIGSGVANVSGRVSMRPPVFRPSEGDSDGVVKVIPKLLGDK